MATLPFNRRLFTFGAKLESTFGTKASLANTDCAFRVMNPKILPVGSQVMIPAGSGLADIGAVNGAYSGAMTFDMELYNNSSVWPARLLPACGFPLSNTASTYAICDVLSAGATSNGWNTITGGLWWTEGAGGGASAGTLTYGCYGAMGNLSLKLTAGMPIMGTFRFAGAFTESPGSLPTGVTFESTLPPLFNSFTVDGSTSLSIPGFSIESDDYVELIPIPNTSGCVKYAWLRKQNWRVKFDPLQDAVDWVNDWLINGTGHSFSAVAGVNSGNIITVAGTMVSVDAPGKDDRDENLVTPLSMAILNNNLTIAFS